MTTLRQSINVKSIVFFFCAFLVSFGAMAQSAHVIYPDKLGIQTYTYRNAMKKDVPATLDTIAKLGIGIIESSASPDGLSPQAYRELLDQKKLKCVSVGIGYEELMKDPAAVIRDAKVVGAKYIMVAWIPHKPGSGTFTLEDAKKAAADFNRAGKMIHDSGLVFCYHAHGYEFVPYQQSTLFDLMVTTTNPDYVSFEMDMMWAYFGGQDPAKLMLKYPNRWKLMHLKDLRKGVKTDLSGGTSEENDVVLGTGQLDVKAILKAAAKIGIEYYFIEDESSSYASQVPQTINYLKSGGF